MNKQIKMTTASSTANVEIDRLLKEGHHIDALLSVPMMGKNSFNEWVMQGSQVIIVYTPKNK